MAPKSFTSGGRASGLPWLRLRRPQQFAAPIKVTSNLFPRRSATESMLKPSTASSVTNFWAFASTAKGESSGETCVEIKFRASRAVDATCFRSYVCAMAWRSTRR